MGTANGKNGGMAPLVLSRGMMATVVMCPGLGEVDKRGVLGTQLVIRSSSKTSKPSFFLLFPHLLIIMPHIAQDTYCIHKVSVFCTDQGRYPHSHANVIDHYPKNTTTLIVWTVQGWVISITP